MEWDKIKMAQHFLRRANGLSPEEATGDEKDAVLGRQELLYECYMNAFSRERLITFLQSVLGGGKIEVPENADGRNFRQGYQHQAKAILAELEKQG